MQLLDYGVFFLLVIHLLETSIVLTLLLKVLFHKDTIEKVYFIKVIILTGILLFFIYIGYDLLYFLSITVLNFWLNNVYPFLSLLITYFYLKYVLHNQDNFKKDFADNQLIDYLQNPF